MKPIIEPNIINILSSDFTSTQEDQYEYENLEYSKEDDEFGSSEESEEEFGSSEQSEKEQESVFAKIFKTIIQILNTYIVPIFKILTKFLNAISRFRETFKWWRTTKKRGWT